MRTFSIYPSTTFLASLLSTAFALGFCVLEGTRVCPSTILWVDIKILCKVTTNLTHSLLPVLAPSSNCILVVLIDVGLSNRAGDQ
jgi:hypothetical protein